MSDDHRVAASTDDEQAEQGEAQAPETESQSAAEAEQPAADDPPAPAKAKAKAKATPGARPAAKAAAKKRAEAASPSTATKKTPQAKAASDGDGAAGTDSWAPRPIMGTWQAYGLATISAILCPISFAGIDLWPLSFVAWVPLIVAMRGQTPRRAAGLAWWAGFGMTMIGFYWLINMLAVFSGFPLPLCVLFAAILCLQMGGRIALFGYLYARATRRGYHHGLVLLAAFAVSELIYPVLFPWYYGASVHQLPLMMQTADLGGPILVSLVLLASNLALAELLERPLFKLAPDRRTLIGGLAAVVLAAGYGGLRISQVDAAVAEAKAVKVGMVQGNLPLKGRSQALAIHLRRTEELRRQGVELVVWSEASVPRAFNVADYQLAFKERVTRHLKVPTIASGVLYERIDDPDPRGRRARFYNSALMADAAGNVTGRYDKQYLLMFGEYLPLGETFPILYRWSPNSGNFTPGTSFEPLLFGDYRVATMICYEDILPSFVNKLAHSDPHLLVNMTNDAWFGDTTEPWIHLALAKFRSIEQRRFMVRVTNSGVSAIIDPVGRTPVVSEPFKEQALSGEVRMLQLGSVYRQLGDVPWWLLTALLAIACFFRRAKGSAAS